MAQWVRYLNYPATHTSLLPIRRGFAPCFVNYNKTRLAAASDKVYRLLAHGRWLSPGTPASSTTKTVRHDIAEILLKVALSTKKSINQSINLIIEDPTVTVKCRTAIKSLFLYINFVCLCKVRWSLMFIYIHILSYKLTEIFLVWSSKKLTSVLSISIFTFSSSFCNHQTF